MQDASKIPVIEKIENFTMNMLDQYRSMVVFERQDNHITEMHLTAYISPSAVKTAFETMKEYFEEDGGYHINITLTDKATFKITYF